MSYPSNLADRTHRRAAIIAGHLGDSATARTYLADTSDAVRAAALGALQRTGDLEPGELQRGLDDESALVRRRTLEIVAALGGQGAAATVSTLPHLDDPDPVIVEVAAWCAGERDPAEPGAVERLSALATGADDALVREAAVASLGSIGDHAGLEAILAATEDKATVRRRAVLALAPFDGEAVDAALQRALTDRDWQVRQAAEDLTEA